MIVIVDVDDGEKSYVAAGILPAYAFHNDLRPMGDCVLLLSSTGAWPTTPATTTPGGP